MRKQGIQELVGRAMVDPDFLDSLVRAPEPTLVEYFGEMSLFDQAPRSATVQADGETVLLCLDRESLQQFVEVSPRAAAAFFSTLVRTIIQRLRASGDLVAEVARWGLEATGLDVETR